MKQRKVLFLGPPGAGKGTQAKEVSAQFELAHISTGDMLRAEMGSGSALGQEVKSVVEAGNLVSDELMIAIVKERIAQADCVNGYILDGFPRTVVQAEELGKIASLDMAIEIHVDDEKLVERITQRRSCAQCHAISSAKNVSGDTCPNCGGTLLQREDDKEETVRNRLKVYHEQTQPLIDYYKQRGLLRSVDGDRPINVVRDEIAALLETL